MPSCRRCSARSTATAISCRRRQCRRSPRRPGGRCPTATSRAPARSAATTVARGDQCDNCGNQLDPIDLIHPRSRINGETPKFVETEHFFLDLPALAGALGDWLRTRDDWRPNVLKFSLNLLDDLRPRAMTRDIDWGIPVPLDGWRDRPDKKLYVWFDAVIGYLSASIEWSRRYGRDPQEWQRWWTDDVAKQFYFMGKDNITFHSQIWPAELLGYDGAGEKGGAPGQFGRLNLPTEVVSSEFLKMSGSKLSTSRGTVIYVRDFLGRSAPTRCATSSRSPVRRPRTSTSPGTSSSGAPTSNWPTSGATWSTGRSRWPTRTSVRFRHRATLLDVDADLLATSRPRVRHGRRTAGTQQVPRGGHRIHAGGVGGQQVHLGDRAVEAG